MAEPNINEVIQKVKMMDIDKLSKDLEELSPHEKVIFRIGFKEALIQVCQVYRLELTAALNVFRED